MTNKSSKDTTESKPIPVTPSYTRESISRYQREKTRRASFFVYSDLEPEILDKLQSQQNYSAYIRQLLIESVSNPLNEDEIVPEYSDSAKAPKERFVFLVNKEKYPKVAQLLDNSLNMTGMIKGLINRDLKSDN